MNILFISNDPSIFVDGSAARTRMRAYAEEVAKTGGMLHILSRAAQAAEISDGPLILHGVAGNKLWCLFRMPGIARKIIHTHQIAVVAAHAPFVYGRVALRATRGTPAKLHIQIHTDFLSPWFTRSSMSRSPRVPMPYLNRARQKIANHVLPHADGVRVVSKRIKDSLIARYGEKFQSVTVIPILVDPALPEKVQFPEPVYPFTLFTASRLEPEKRIEDILYAIAGLQDQYPAVGLVIAGEGSERSRLEKMIQELGITQRIRLLGARTDVRGLMQSAQAYIQASAYEGYGITLVEAALARIPIITTDVGIVGDVLKGNEAVLAAPPGDPAQLLQNIRTLIESTRRRIELTMNAEQAVKEHLVNAHNTPADIIADMTRLAV
jgi:glycosyltransferase involved in cell wall biosynthesis